MTERRKILNRGSWRLEALTFTAGASVTNSAIDARGFRLAKIFIPSNWTAAKVTVNEAALASGTFYPIQEEILAANIALTATAGKPIGISSYVAALSGLSYFKLGSVSTSDGSTAVNQAGTAASKAVTVETGKVLTFTSGVAGTASNALTLTIQANTTDDLAVSNPAGTSNILIKLATTTASKNAASAIQAAIRAIAGGAVGGVAITGFTVTGDTAYNAAPTTTPAAGLTALALSGGADTTVYVVLME